MFARVAVWCPLALLVHEFGHYIVAKKRGIYRGWRIYPTPMIFLMTPFPIRYDNLSGIISSLFVTPILLFVGGILLFSIGLVVCIILGLADLAIFGIFNKIKRTGRWDATNLINKHFIFGLPKVVLLFLISFSLLALIYLELPKPPIDPQLVLTAIVMISIAIALKFTNWITKLVQIVRSIK